MYRNPVANITPKTVVFDPERSSRSFFKVSVTNTSERFLSFQVRVYPQGAQGSEFHHWYRLKPRVCAKKPPGTTADFEVEIADSPIPGSEGEIPLVFEIQALENRRLATTVQGHTVKVLAGRYLSLNLLAPDNQIRVDAGKRVSIPVRVRNARKKAVEVSLQLTPMALPPDWLETEDVQLTVGADSAESAAFSVVVPQASQTEGERPYEFAIEIVKPKLTQKVRSLGTLIVNPSGVLEFDCPTRDRIFPDDRDSERDRPEKPPIAQESKDAKALSRSVCYPIELTNRSNLSQTLNFEISPHTHLSKKEDIICRIEPETVTLKPGEQKPFTPSSPTSNNRRGSIGS
ncbi:hypothetical protein [Baaleninema sp.]|uniref:hypothetical protein n=1 Tax=Baaleninema sp. TaxID=3101197 RepID=UPI003D0293EC